jgi:hypothetical protein
MNFLLNDLVRNPWIEYWSQHAGILAPVTLPRHLYRGEPGCYETTLCGEERPDIYNLEDGRELSAEDRIRLQHLKAFLLRQLKLKDDYDLTENEALGFLQHYGLPTNLIDFSGDLPCACAFAASGNEAFGRIAVMQWPESSRVVTAHRFWDHPWANRAQRQKAVGISVVKGLNNLKSDAARTRLGLKWYQFPKSDAERVHFRTKKAELLHHGNDESAGFLRLHITEYVEAYGKLSPNLTDWLLRRIPIAARCFMVKAFELPEVVVNFRYTNHLPAFRPDVETLCSLRYWSSAHPDCSFDRMENWKWPEVGAITADPRTYHPDL